MAEKKVYEPPKFEIVEADTGGNTGLPFGLCKKYGIETQKDWTPRDAWNALKNNLGVDPEDVYKELDDKEKTEEIETNSVEGSATIEAVLNERRFLPQKTQKRKLYEENFNYANEEAKGLTARLFIDDSFLLGDPPNSKRTTGFYRQANHVGIMQKELRYDPNSIYSKGGVLYHEIWHAIDNNYGHGNGNPFSALSTDYVTNNGSLLDCVIEEAGKLDVTALKNDIEEETNAYYKKQGIDRKKIVEEYKQAKAGLNVPDSQNIANYWDKLDKYVKYPIPGEVLQKWSDLSDVVSGQTNDPAGLCNAGHPKGYFYNKQNRGREIFAELGSAKATNPESYELLKKHLPKTTAAFEEIYNKLKTGEIKSNGRPKRFV